MTYRKTTYRRVLPLLVLLLAFLLVGCMGQLGTSWAGLTVLEGQERLVYAHENTLAILDLTDDGRPVPLVDSDGNRLVGQDGNPVGWEVAGRDFDNAQFFASPLQLNDETLLVPTAAGRLLEFDLTTAGVRSAEGVAVQERGNLVTDPSLTNGTIFIGLQQQLMALDVETLEPRWTAETEHAVWSEPVVVAQETVYFTSLDHNLYAVDYVTGEQVWVVDLGGAAAGRPVYEPESNRLFVGTFGSEIVAIDAATGEELATYETADWVWGAPALIEEDEGLMLYVADLAGNVYKLNADSMTQEGGWQTAVAEAGIRATPVVYDDYVVVGSRDQHVYWLDRRTGGIIEDSCQLNGEILSDIIYLEAPQPAEGEDADESVLAEDILIVSTLRRNEVVALPTSVEGLECGVDGRLWTYP